MKKAKLYIKDYNKNSDTLIEDEELVGMTIKEIYEDFCQDVRVVGLEYNGTNIEDYKKSNITIKKSDNIIIKVFLDEEDTDSLFDNIEELED